MPVKVTFTDSGRIIFRGVSSHVTSVNLLLITVTLPTSKIVFAKKDDVLALSILKGHNCLTTCKFSAKSLLFKAYVGKSTIALDSNKEPLFRASNGLEITCAANFLTVCSNNDISRL